MHSLAHHVLLGSLIAAAAGAVLLAVVTIKHGLARRTPDPEQSAEDTARRQRTIRLADTLAVLCFAVSAGLGVLGLMQHTRTVTPAAAAIDDHGLAERLLAIEKRVATAELELQNRGGSAAPEWRAWEERIARLEHRLGAVEERAAAVAARRVERPRVVAPAPPPRPMAPVTSAPRAASPAAVAPRAPDASASPRLSPDPSVGVDLATPPRPEASMPVAPPPHRPEPGVPPAFTAPSKPEPSAPFTAAPQSPPPAAAPTPAREPTRVRIAPPPEDVSLGDRLSRDWETIKRQARRGGDDWREGWDQLKRLFGY